MTYSGRRSRVPRFDSSDGTCTITILCKPVCYSFAGPSLRNPTRLALPSCLTTRSSVATAFWRAVMSVTSSVRSPSANALTRRARPSAISVRPSAVARRRTTRPSCSSGSRVTRPCTSSARTRRVIVGGRTCSAVASSPRVSGPAKTTTERAESRGPLNPVRASSRRRRRSRWIVAECSRSASSVAASLGTQVVADTRGLALRTGTPHSS
jgi:hypothetical protein